MRQSNWTPSIVPNGDDQNVYLVLGRSRPARAGLARGRYRNDHLETVIKDLLSEQYGDPVRVVSFNTAEGWSQDASGDVADELRRRSDLQSNDVPSAIQNFVERHEVRWPRQLTLRLV